MGLDAFLDARYKKVKSSIKVTKENIGYWRQNWVLNAQMGKILDFNIDDNGSSHKINIEQIDKIINYCQGQTSRRKSSSWFDEDLKWDETINIFTKAKNLIIEKEATIIYWFIY